MRKQASNAKANKSEASVKRNPKLSVVILNYNTMQLLDDCLSSLKKLEKEVDFEVIVSDNGSTDGSLAMVAKKFPKVKVIENNENLGFGRGNNRAKKLSKGKYVLFLNTDTIVDQNALKSCVDYLEMHKDVGAVTCRVELKNGKLDKDTRRSFPTPWVSLTHLVLKLDKIFPKSKLFAKYWYGYIPEDATHDVDVIQAAFLMAPRKLLNELDWFDEDYYLDGEDIDLCWRIKNKGKRLVYYPKAKIIHLKGFTKGKNKKSKKKVSLAEKIKFRSSSVNSMEIFYRKRLWKNYPLLLNSLVIAGIKVLKGIRIIKLIIFG